jgi:tetrathionate reductase subunit C
MDIHIHELVGTAHEAAWLPWAVQYFFLIALSVCAFVLTLPAFALRREEGLPLGRVALITAVTTGIAAPVALLADLHQPARFWHFYAHTHDTSWMAWGAWIVPAYVGLLLLYAWAIHRPAFHRLGVEDWRLAPLFRLLALGGSGNGFTPLIAGLTLAAALGVATYTGVEVFVVKARPLWNTPILPLQFIATGFVGALGVILVLNRSLGVDKGVERSAHRGLVQALVVVAVLGALWMVLGLTGASDTHARALASVAGFPVWRMIALWAALAVALPLVLALVLPVGSGWVTGLLAIHAAWMFRWTVFMGGQAVPKVGSGLYDALAPQGLEGLMGVIGTFGLWLFLAIAYTSIVPWRDAGTPDGGESPLSAPVGHKG